MLAALYPTKKVLKEHIGKPLRYRETSVFGPEYRENGVLTVVGPDERRRRWFASVTMVNGLVSRVS